MSYVYEQDYNPEVKVLDFSDLLSTFFKSVLLFVRSGWRD